MNAPRPGFADDLDETLAEAFRLLARGVADRRSPFHTPTLATIAADGAPSLRTLVLRGFDAPSRTLRLHTDARSAKVAELRCDPRAALHAYDAGAHIQLRLAGEAMLSFDDADADAAWARATPNSRLVYAQHAAPGTPMADPVLPPFTGDARVHFATIAFRFHSLEWLWLAAGGHRRARFTWDGAVRTGAEWRAP